MTGRAFGFALAAGVVILDQLTKWIVLGPLALSPPQCLQHELDCGKMELSSIVDLTMLWNRGVSFDMLQAETGFGRWVLVVFSTVVAIALGGWLRKTARPLIAIALGLVIGGALGNMIDRARFGAVVDFIDFSGPWFGVVIGSWELGFPWVINVADAAISTGAALLALELLLDRRPKALQA